MTHADLAAKIMKALVDSDCVWLSYGHAIENTERLVQAVLDAEVQPDERDEQLFDLAWQGAVKNHEALAGYRGHDTQLFSACLHPDCVLMRGPRSAPPAGAASEKT